MFVKPCLLCSIPPPPSPACLKLLHGTIYEETILRATSSYNSVTHISLLGADLDDRRLLSSTAGKPVPIRCRFHIIFPKSPQICCTFSSLRSYDMLICRSSSHTSWPIILICNVKKLLYLFPISSAPTGRTRLVRWFLLLRSGPMSLAFII